MQIKNIVFRVLWLILALTLLGASLLAAAIATLLADWHIINGVGSKYLGYCTGAAVLFTLWWLCCVLFRKRMPGWKITKKALPLCLLLALAGVAASVAHTLWWTSAPRVREAWIIRDDYQPLYSDKLAVLDEAPTLTLEQPWPMLDGATALLPVYGAVAQAVYPAEALDEEADTEICTYNGGTSMAYNALVDGQVDIIFAAAPSERQLEEAAKFGLNLKLTPIGREAFVFFTNKNNPVESLTQQELRFIYAGYISNWKEVGGPSTAILPFQRNEGSGSQSAMLRFMPPARLMPAPEERVPGDMFGMVDNVAVYRNHAGALGYSFRFFLENMAARPKIKMLQVDGVAPTLENIQSGAYPLSSYFYAVTAHPLEGPDKRDPALLRNMNLLLEWLLSPQGQKLIKKSGYTPLH